MEFITFVQGPCLGILILLQLSRGPQRGVCCVELITKYSPLPITRTFKGNRKKFRVIGSSKKTAESNVKNSFYCTVNIL